MPPRSPKLPAPITLEMAPLPRLVWNGYFWTGEVKLPSWRGYQSRNGAYGARSSKRASDGKARLSLGHEGHDGPRLVPTHEQIAAFSFLLANETPIASVAVRALYDHARKEITEWPFDEDDEEGPAPKLTSREGLRKLMGLSTVHVLSSSLDGVAYVGLELGCTWDDEHGAGVLLHKKRLVDVGHASVSFHEGEASADARRAKRSAKVAKK